MSVTLCGRVSVAGKTISEIVSPPAPLFGEQYGGIGQCSQNGLQLRFQEWNHLPSRKASSVPGRLPSESAIGGHGSVPTLSSGGRED